MSLKKDKQNQLNDKKPEKKEAPGFVKENFTAIVFFSVLIGAILLSFIGKGIWGVIDAGNISGKHYVDEEKGFAVMTYPAEFFKTVEAMQETADTLKGTDGVIRVVENKDGSLTFKMNMARYKKIVDSLEITARGMVASTITEESGIIDAVPADDYTKIELTVNRDVFKNNSDPLQMCVYTARMYLVCNMKQNENITVTYKDNDTGEVYLTEVYDTKGNIVSNVSVPENETISVTEE